MALKALATVTQVDIDENDADLVVVGLTVIVFGGDFGDLGQSRYGALLAGINPTNSGIMADIEEALLADMANHGIAIDPADTVKIIR
jgi:hypothetical protein